MILVGEVSEVPKRVISLNPSVSEFLALLGVELVGRDVYSKRPRELLSLPKVGTFVKVELETLASLKPDLVVLYYPVQREYLEPVAKYAKAVAAVPTPMNVDQVVGVFRAISRIFDRDEEGDRLAGIYRDLLRGPPLYENVLAVIKFDVYHVACSNSYIADALSRVGLRYMRGLPCVFRDKLPPSADFVVFESSGRSLIESEVAFLAGRRHVVTPNDTIAHYGPSLPLDLQRVAKAAAAGARFVSEVSSVLLPWLRDNWYKPYR